MKDVFQGFNQKSGTKRSSKSNFIYHLDDVSVNFGKLQALKSVNLTINPGEILFITGRSGAGKTTLLNTLAGDLKPNKGRVYHPNDTLFVSQIFQDLKLFQDLTCLENLQFAYDRTLYASRAEFEEDLLELVKVLGVKDKLNIPIAKANGGLKQKIALIRALLARPNVLLADEPTCSLDKESSIKLFEVLNFYNIKRKLTIIWASHNRELVKQFPGKIIHLENGKLIYSGHACFI
jgi:cell division transport system ATP-binding protein